MRYRSTAKLYQRLLFNFEGWFVEFYPAKFYDSQAIAHPWWNNCVLLISDTNPGYYNSWANEDFTLPFDNAIDWVANNWCLGKQKRYLQLIAVQIPDFMDFLLVTTRKELVISFFYRKIFFWHTLLYKTYHDKTGICINELSFQNTNTHKLKKHWHYYNLVIYNPYYMTSIITIVTIKGNYRNNYPWK